MKLKITCGALLCAAAALTATKAQAQATDNDLLLCFRATAGTGADVNLYVNLGNVVSPEPIQETLSLNSDLTSVYGSSWASDSNLYWSVIGTTGALAGGAYSADDLFVSSPDPADNPSDPGSPLQQSATRGAIENVYLAANSGTAGAISQSSFGPSSGNSSSYGSEYASEFNNGGFDMTFEQSGDVASGPLSSDVYELYAGSMLTKQQIDLGTVTLSSDGNFAVSVPEPSTWAMLILGAASLLVLRRRRSLA